MNPRLHPTRPIFITFTVIIVIVVSFPAISCQESRPYDVCGEVVQCGDFRLHYPFWGSGRPAYCGYPGFQLTCESNVSLLSYQSVNYQILDTDTSTQTITIARNDLWDDFCPEYLYNTSYDSTLFGVDISGDQENVSLYYGCNTSTPTIPLGANHLFSCNVNDTQSDGYFLRTNQIVSNMTSFLRQCQNYITVPVKQYLAGRLASPFATADELRPALMAGFDLIWIANDVECNQCMRSNGRCGSNSTSPELFACYCDNGIFSLTCNNTNGSGGIMGAASLKLIIGISSAIAGILIILLVTFFRIKRWKTQGLIRPHRKPRLLGTSRNHQIEIFIRDYGPIAPNRFRYSEIKKMTNSFVEKLGQGGYGSVYKGQLPDGQLVAENIASTTNMSAIYFPDTMYRKLEDGENVEVDGVKTEEDEELAKKMVMVSLWCIQSDPSDRPSISKVVEMLEGSFQSLHVPTKRFWSSPTRYSQGTSASTTLDSSHERVLTQATREDLST
ncbi:unnamed protein product [Lactuca virosa]|uniref:non-specific serine/threonine protein kinase n=1 Tax=Lactuca virosa TaxID=75947 RepID=A0AAU9M4C2_9ASTR|nr:unnamed protein product [Lactuca virosa]